MKAKLDGACNQDARGHTTHIDKVSSSREGGRRCARVGAGCSRGSNKDGEGRGGERLPVAASRGFSVAVPPNDGDVVLHKAEGWGGNQALPKRCMHCGCSAAARMLRTVVPGLRLLNVPVAPVLLCSISGQVGQLACFTVQLYCTGSRRTDAITHQNTDSGHGASRVCAGKRRQPTSTKGKMPGTGVAVAVPAEGPVALADSRLSWAGVVSWELPGSWTSVELDSTHSAFTSYVVPGFSPPTVHLNMAHATTVQGLLGGREGHRRSL